MKLNLCIVGFVVILYYWDRNIERPGLDWIGMDWDGID